MEGDGADGEQGAWLQVPGGPQLVLCALGVLSGGGVVWRGCCLEGLFHRLFLVGPGGWGRLVTGLVQGPHRCPGDRLCSAPEWAEWFLLRRLL